MSRTPKQVTRYSVLYLYFWNFAVFLEALSLDTPNSSHADVQVAGTYHAISQGLLFDEAASADRRSARGVGGRR